MTTVDEPGPSDAKRPNALVRLYRGETSFDFIGRRRWWYLLSGTIILAGLISLGVRGLNLGIEFKGGTSWEVPANGVSVTSATNAVKAAGVTPSLVETFGLGSSTQIEVQADLTKLPQVERQVVEDRVAVALAKTTHSSVSAAEQNINDVGATWGSTVTDKAIEAMVVFFVLVTIYIAFRFQWRMAVAALLKVVLHDLLLTVGIFSLTNFQVTPDGVIAVLTIMGYSLYDTVVVFDKINENTKGFGASRKITYAELVNLSLNQVLARSINTSLVAILPVLSVLVIGAQILGANTLQQFGFPLVIGLISGAYSSIFIAAPVPGAMRRRDERTLARRRSEVPLTPRAAATILAGATVGPAQSSQRSGAARGAAARRQVQVQSRSGQPLRPGVAKGRPAVPATPADVFADVDGDGVEALTPAARGNGATRKGAGAPRPASSARRPPPRKKGGGKKGGRRR